MLEVRLHVFQTHGAKLWEVHPAPGENAEVREVLLEPGLSMYLPTGTPHAAGATSIGKLRVVPEANAGPPVTPVGPRVSTIRHGVTEKN